MRKIVFYEIEMEMQPLAFQLTDQEDVRILANTFNTFDHIPSLGNDALFLG